MKQIKLSQKSLGLEPDRVRHDKGNLTTNQGVGIANTDDTLKAGTRGPTLMQDFAFREKLTHFDHERIPERIVHARGSGAHGYFQVYESLSDLTCAHFLGDPKLVTPVFCRFSTVAGSRGSADTVRDVRGFAVKFYTEQGNYDIVGNNMPVFFIQDAIKFPDLIHAVKPEPHNEMPQAASAHDTFWDFVAHTPEAMHNVLWLMSDRALPRSYRMMEGFGIHTFRFVNAQGDARFVKFHWKPVLGLHSLLWDECQKIAGKDPDFHRRDLWDAIENGCPAEFELGIQTLEPSEEFAYDFDVLDCTKLWPEELVPVRRVGKMTLNQNVSNFFAETEQIAFCPANVVPGIDFSNDPMLQGRLFSYLDTQLSRLGGPNFQQIPINRPMHPVQNNQRDGLHRMSIDEGQTAYSPNGLAQGEPHPAQQEPHFHPLEQKLEGYVVRERSSSFRDHFSQPAMFWASQSEPEQQHLVEAFRFELGKCRHVPTREAIVAMLCQVDVELARAVAAGIGVAPPAKSGKKTKKPFISPALSMQNTPKSVQSRKVAVLLEPGFDRAQYDSMTKALGEAGACVEVVSSILGEIKPAQGEPAESGQSYATADAVLYDAVFVPGGAHSEALARNGCAKTFLNEMQTHCKPMALAGNAAELLAVCEIAPREGIVCGQNASELRALPKLFLAALQEGRFWCAAQPTFRVLPS